jgi:DNA-binding response OmpR family regulator
MVTSKIQPYAKQITYKNHTITLTKNEFKILQILMENHGKIVSRDTLMEKLWETSSFIDDNTLTVNVNRLRKTLLEAGVSDYIGTRKGLGYIVS